MLSLMSMGLMRATATKIIPSAPRRDLDVAGMADWLKAADSKTLRFSPLMLDEAQELGTACWNRPAD